MISGLLTRFADSGPSVHVAPAEVFQIGGITVTNSMLYGWICAVIICTSLIWAARKVTIKPKAGFTQIVEYGTEFVTNLVEGAFDDKRVGRKYVTFFTTLFFFILFSNWLGLLPIVGE